MHTIVLRGRDRVAKVVRVPSGRDFKEEVSLRSMIFSYNNLSANRKVLNPQVISRL